MKNTVKFFLFFTTFLGAMEEKIALDPHSDPKVFIKRYQDFIHEQTKKISDFKKNNAQDSQNPVKLFEYATHITTEPYQKSILSFLMQFPKTHRKFFTNPVFEKINVCMQSIKKFVNEDQELCDAFWNRNEQIIQWNLDGCIIINDFFKYPAIDKIENDQQIQELYSQIYNKNYLINFRFMLNRFVENVYQGFETVWYCFMKDVKEKKDNLEKKYRHLFLGMRGFDVASNAQIKNAEDVFALQKTHGIYYRLLVDALNATEHIDYKNPMIQIYANGMFRKLINMKNLNVYAKDSSFADLIMYQEARLIVQHPIKHDVRDHLFKKLRQSTSVNREMRPSFQDFINQLKHMHENSIISIFTKCNTSLLVDSKTKDLENYLKSEVKFPKALCDMAMLIN